MEADEATYLNAFDFDTLWSKWCGLAGALALDVTVGLGIPHDSRDECAGDGTCDCHACAIMQQSTVSLALVPFGYLLLSWLCAYVRHL